MRGRCFADWPSAISRRRAGTSRHYGPGTGASEKQAFFPNEPKFYFCKIISKWFIENHLPAKNGVVKKLRGTCATPPGSAGGRATRPGAKSRRFPGGCCRGPTRRLEADFAAKQSLAERRGGSYLEGEFARAHGMWTYEPRQGRNAATAVCSASAVVTLA